MLEYEVLMGILDENLQQRGYRPIPKKSDFSLLRENIYEYKRINSPRMTISIIRNLDEDRGYFIFQLSYRRKIYEPGMILVRFMDLKSENDLINEMDEVFEYWKQY